MLSLIQVRNWLKYIQNVGPTRPEMQRQVWNSFQFDTAVVWNQAVLQLNRPA